MTVSIYSHDTDAYEKVVHVSIPGVLQSMIFSYLTVVLSTVEKQFGLKSKEAAWIYSGNEISQICFAVFIPFVGRLRKRPLVMGAASCLASFGILIIATPHFAGRGSAVIQGERAEGSCKKTVHYISPK